MKLKYNQKLKEFAKHHRNNSTKSEIKLWTYLKNRQLNDYKFNRQKPIGNYIADFYCHKLCLAIEVDGSTHDSLEVQQKDNLKDEYFYKVGLKVLRFTGYDIFDNIEGVFQTIQAYIIEFKARNTP